MTPQQALLELHKILPALGGSWPSSADPVVLGLLQQLWTHPPSVEDRLLAFFRAAGGSTTLTHAEIGEAIGSTRESVTKACGELGIRAYHNAEHERVWALRQRPALRRPVQRPGVNLLRVSQGIHNEKRVRSLFVDGEFQGHAKVAAKQLGMSRVTLSKYFKRIGAQRVDCCHWRLPAKKEAA